MPAKRFASMVLPEPGGPIIKTLWPPAAATSSARLAVVCPRTSRKSGRHSSGESKAGGDEGVGWNLSGWLRYATTSERCRMPNTRTPSVTAASAALSAGTHQGGRPLTARADRDRQHAAHRPQRTIERELAHQHMFVGFAHRSHGAENAQGHRKIEARAFLAHIGGSEVDSDGFVGIAEAG